MSHSSDTSPDQGRRGILRGRLHARKAIRPPWGLPEPDFLTRCTRCGDCYEACQDQVLIKGDGGFPEIDFARGGCSMCGDCSTHCGAGAFRPPPHEPADAWMHRVRLGDSCMARRGVVCRTCGDVCDFRAIRFQLRVGGAAMPLLDLSSCTGCGECIAVCPVQAIQIDHARSTTEGESANV